MRAPRRRDGPGVWISLDLSHIAFDSRAPDEIAGAIPPGRRLQVCAEEGAVTDRALDLVLGASRAGHPVEATLQANLSRSPADADRLAAAGVPVRLVKARTSSARPTRCRGAGRPTPPTVRWPAGCMPAAPGLALATHDRALRDGLLAELPAARCELLLGVRPSDATALAAAGRVYVPYGEAWFRYFMRRRAEAQGA